MTLVRRAVQVSVYGAHWRVIDDICVQTQKEQTTSS